MTIDRRRPGLLALALAVTVLAVAGTSANAGWTGAGSWDVENLERHADAVIDADGNATVVWETWIYRARTIPGQRVWSASRPAGGEWSAAVPVATPAEGRNQWYPRLAVEPDGDVTVVYQEGDILGSSELNGRIMSAVKAPNGAWGPAEAISDAGDWLGRPDVTVDGAGDTWAGWARGAGVDPDICRTEVARRPPGGGWQPAEDASPGLCFSGIELAAGGGAVALFGTSSAYAAYRETDGSWSSRALTASAPGRPEYNGTDHLAVDAAGRAVAVWQDRASFDILTAERDPGGDWSAPVVLADEGIYPAMTANGHGDIVATWYRKDYDADRSFHAAAFRPSGGAFGAVQPVAAWAVEQGYDNPVVALDDDGVATYLNRRDPGVRSTRGKPGSTGWDPLAPSDPGDSGAYGDAANPVIATNAAGDLITAQASVSASYQGAFAIGGDWNGPRLEQLTVPASVVAGAEATLSVAPRDVWSTVAAVSWEFGDGTPAVGGETARHTWTSAGETTVTVTAADALGNSSSATRTVTVTAGGDPDPGRGRDGRDGGDPDPGRGRDGRDGGDPDPGPGDPGTGPGPGSGPGDPGSGRGTDPGPGPGSGSGPGRARSPADRTPPHLSAVTLSRARLSLKLSEPGRVTVTVERCRSVRKRGRTVTVCSRAAKLSFGAGAGRSAVRLRRTLPAGRYRLTVSARDAAGNHARVSGRATLR